MTSLAERNITLKCQETLENNIHEKIEIIGIFYDWTVPTWRCRSQGPGPEDAVNLLRHGTHGEIVNFFVKFRFSLL